MNRIDVFYCISSPLQTDTNGQKYYWDLYDFLKDTFNNPPLTIGGTSQISNNDNLIYSIKLHMENVKGFMALACKKVYDESAKGWCSSLYVQIETAMAYQAGIPILVIKDKDVIDTQGVLKNRNHNANMYKIIETNLVNFQNDYSNNKKLFDDWVSSIRQ